MKKITVVLLLSFISLSGFSQTLQEGFEGTTFPPTTPAPGWVTFQNAIGTRPWGASIVAHTGTGAAQMNSRQNNGINTTSKDFLVTPLVTIPANGQLRFWARTENNGNQGTLYQIRVANGANVANQTSEAAFNVAPTNLIQQWTEDEISTTYNMYEEKVVNFPTALIGQAVYIAFVNEYTQMSTLISGDTWYVDDVLLVSRCLDPTILTANPILSTSATLGWTNPNGLTYGNPCTQWEVEIIPATQLVPSGVGIIVNTNPSYNATTLTAAPFAPLLPLTQYKYYVKSICTFSSSLWAGPFPFTTSAAPPVCGGNYVDSGGIASNYSNNETAATTTQVICPTNPGDLVTVTFTSFATEAGWDFLKIYDGNVVSAATLLGNFSGTLNLGSFTGTSALGCLTFVFTSDTSGTAAGWTSNITCAPRPTCTRPNTVLTSAATASSVTLNWVQPANPDTTVATAWECIALPCASATPTPASTGWVPATAPPFIMTGLLPGTCYDFYVRAVCSSTDSSAWSAPKSATTMPGCGGPFMDAGGTANYPNSSNSIVTICPTNPGEIVTVTFTSFNTETRWDGLYVYDGNSVTSTPILSTNLAGLGQLTQPGAFWGTTGPGTVTATSASGCLTFKFISDSSFNNPGWTANVTCALPPTCSKPKNLTVTSITQSSALVGWTQPANPDSSIASAWQVLVLPCSAAVPTSTTTGWITATSNPFYLTGLNPATCYNYYVRANCSLTDASLWSVPKSFNTLIANDECIGAITLPVNQNTNCLQTVTGSLAFATASSEANTCGATADDDDVWFSFTATATSHYITILGANYTIAPTNINYVLYTGTCGLLTQFGGCVTANNNIANGLTIGQTYYIRAYSTGTTAVTTIFELCIGTNVGSCPTALPLCAIQPIVIPNNVGVPSIPNPISPFSTTSSTVGCLGSAPSPTFYYLQIPSNGNYNFFLEQNTSIDFTGTGIDVDFVAWGPYTVTTAACAGITTANAPPTGIGCSYSAAFTENFGVNNAIAGQIYVIMITNFNGRKGFVRITQTTGPIPTVCCPFGNFTYSSSFYCQNGANPSPAFVSNATAGTFSAVPSTGLSINSSTGLINLAASTAGTYVIHNSIASSGTCPSDDDSWTITITAPPSTVGISYSATTYCKTNTTLQIATQSGPSGGTYTIFPATGLSLNTSTGSFTPSLSTAGNYVVTYNLPAFLGCPGATTSANVTILALPSATFNYNSTTYCQSGSNPIPTYTSGGVAGTFSSIPAGLSLDPNTGAINLATSSIGNYTVTNTINTVGVCGTTSAQFNVAVTSSPIATFNYSSLTFCKTGINPIPTFQPGASAGIFTATPATLGLVLVINSNTGEINLSLSDIGSYTITNTIIAANGCSADIKTTQVEILATPLIVQPLPVSVCNRYLLPALTVGNYYSQSGGIGVPLDISVAITTSQTIYIYAQNSICSNEKLFVVTINTVPAPTLNVTQPTCAIQTGTIEVTAPVSAGGGITPNNLFISEVTDESVGSLTYVEIFNGTGASVDLSNYKLKFYNNGGTTTSCDNQLTGILNNNRTFVVAVGTSPSTVITGITPNISFPTCGGVNTNDNIRLTTNSGTEIDLWGSTNGANFTPLNQPGYTYRRNTNASVPSLTWNPADWTVLDPQDYTNVGSYTFSATNYEYSLDGGTYQLPVTFNLVAAGIHTITVHDLVTGCYSLPFSVTLNAVPLIPSVTSFSYPVTPVCKNATVNPVPTPDSGFTSGGTYSSATLGTSLNATSGVIDLAIATSGIHIVNYTVVTNTTTCVQGGSSPFTIVVNPIITPITTISYSSPVCKNATNNPAPDTTTAGFTIGGTYSSTTLGTSLNSVSGVIDLANPNAVAGPHTITYTVNANPATCQVANSSNAIIVINPIVTPITAFDYATPICAIGSMSMPRPGIGFTSGGSYSSTSGLSISSSTGEIISTNSTPGNYVVTYSINAITATCQVSGSGTTNIVISNPIGVTITGECIGSNYTLKANAVGSSFDPSNVTYSWTNAGGSTIGNTQTITVTNPENYSVSVLSNGCTGTANLIVSNTTCTTQKGISPNGDGENEAFILTDVNELSIFNRYGTKVYNHGADYTNEWHGQSNSGSELSDGTYFYVIKRKSGESVTGWIYINR